MRWQVASNSARNCLLIVWYGRCCSFYRQSSACFKRSSLAAITAFWSSISLIFQTSIDFASLSDFDKCCNISFCCCSCILVVRLESLKAGALLTTSLRWTTGRAARVAPWDRRISWHCSRCRRSSEP